MGNMKFKSQICTTREQSERLLALGLSANTADMSYYIDEMYGSYNSYLHPHPPTIKGTVPAWSLHRLVILLPVEVTRNGYKFQLRKDVLSKIDDIDNVYDEVIGVIQRAIELDCFNKDYLEEEK